MAYLPLRVLGAAAALALSFAAAGGRAEPRVEPLGISSATSNITIYGATWCGACKHLEATLTQRNVPFVVIDVDRERDSYEKARNTAGKGNGIPLTNVTRDESVWIVGDNPDAIERAYNGN